VLEVGTHLLCNPGAVYHLKEAAPQLQVLRCRVTGDSAYLYEDDTLVPAAIVLLRGSLVLLRSLTTLRELDLDDDADHALALNSPAWGAMAGMTGLSKLSVRVWRHSLYEVLQLTALQQLTCLSVGVTGTDEWQEKDGEQTLLLFSQVRGTQQAGGCCAEGSVRCFVTRA